MRAAGFRAALHTFAALRAPKAREWRSLAKYWIEGRIHFLVTLKPDDGGTIYLPGDRIERFYKFDTF